MRVLLVAENASNFMGGEAAAPFNYFRYLNEAGIDVWLVTHARVRTELLGTFPGYSHRIAFIEDTRLDKLLFRIGRLLPDKISSQTLGVFGRIKNQYRMRRIARQWIAEHDIELVHLLYPISPLEPTPIHGLGVPVLIGPPLSGGMTYPPGFRRREGLISRIAERLGRSIAGIANRLIPGKRRADVLFVANRQTAASLPAGCKGRVVDTVGEVCIDDTLFNRSAIASAEPSSMGKSVRFIYLGRLVDWKAVDLLLEAFCRLSNTLDPGVVSLEILGDGRERNALQSLASRLGLSEIVEFTGWVTAPEAAERLRRADVFVLPSLRESGGIVVVEAMAMGLPAIVADWGGPAQTVTDSCGIRVDPDSPKAFVQNLADAMLRLAETQELREKMGLAAEQRVSEGAFSWKMKVEATIAIYRETLEAAQIPSDSDKLRKTT